MEFGLIYLNVELVEPLWSLVCSFFSRDNELGLDYSGHLGGPNNSNVICSFLVIIVIVKILYKKNGDEMTQNFEVLK